MIMSFLHSSQKQFLYFFVRILDSVLCLLDLLLLYIVDNNTGSLLKDGYWLIDVYFYNSVLVLI